MKKTVLVSAPYMLPYMDRFHPVLEHFNINLILPQVQERMEEEDLLAYAGSIDGTMCGDDRYTERVIQACSPRIPSPLSTPVGPFPGRCVHPSRFHRGIQHFAGHKDSGIDRPKRFYPPP